MPLSTGRKEQAQIAAPGRFDHDDTDMNPSAQPCMNPGGEQPSGWGPQDTDADFVSVLLNSPPRHSVEENPSENTWSLTGKDIDIIPWHDTHLTPGAGPSGETSGIPATHEPITAQSFDELKLDLSGLQKSSPSYKSSKLVNDIIDHIKNIMFYPAYERYLNNQRIYISFKYHYGPMFIKEKLYKKLEPAHAIKINKAVEFFNGGVEIKNNAQLEKNIQAVAAIVSHPDKARRELSKNIGEPDYYTNHFQKNGVLRGGRNISFLNYLKSSHEKL